MRYLITSLIIIVFFFSNSYSQKKASIAVLELEAVGISHDEAQVLSDRLRTELFKTEKFKVLERDKMDEILEEQGFHLSGCSTNECVVEAGKLIGVEQMVAGKIGKLADLFTINIRLIDIETGGILITATEDCQCPITAVLTNSIKNVARKMAGLKVDGKISSIKTYNPQQQNINQTTNESSIDGRELSDILKDDFGEYKRSGLQLNDFRTFQSESKNPSTAFWLSFFLPGTGQYYSGNVFKGILTDLVIGGGIIFAETIGTETATESTAPIMNDPGSASTTTYVKDESNQKYNDLAYIGWGVAGVVWIWSWFDALNSVIDYNNELKKKYNLSFTPKLNRYSKQPMFGLNIEF